METSVKVYLWWAVLLALALVVLVQTAGSVAGVPALLLLPKITMAILAFAFGLTVGGAELVSRYRDRPVAALGTLPATAYVMVNAAASLGAYWLIATNRLGLGAAFGVNAGATPPDPDALLKALLIGGFGAMAVFRTSVFNFRVGDTTVAVGPAAVLQVILRAADRETDRQCATPRGREVSAIMRDVVFARAKVALPLHCHALMQNVSLQEKADLDAAVAVLDKADMGDEAKSYSLGLYLMSLVGTEVLRGAVGALGGRIKGPRPTQKDDYLAALTVGVGGMRRILLACHALLEGSGVTPRPIVPWNLLAADPAPSGDPLDDAERIMAFIGRLYGAYGSEIVREAVVLVLDKDKPRSSADEVAVANLFARARAGDGAAAGNRAAPVIAPATSRIGTPAASSGQAPTPSPGAAPATPATVAQAASPAGAQAASPAGAQAASPAGAQAASPAGAQAASPAGAPADDRAATATDDATRANPGTPPAVGSEVAIRGVDGRFRVVAVEGDGRVRVLGPWPDRAGAEEQRPVLAADLLPAGSDPAPSDPTPQA